MTADPIYQTWAPDGATWSRWVKPVLFAHLQAEVLATAEDVPVEPFTSLEWVPTSDGSNAVVVDLPGPVSVLLGMALAERGYRPVPLFNAVPEPGSLTHVYGLGPAVVVDMSQVAALLINGAARLGEITLAPNAPPAFLLDSRRRGEGKTLLPRTFDNRSVSLPTDFPSANFLLGEGVKRILIVQAHAGQPQTDLSHTLRRWEEAGLKMFVDRITDPEAPIPITIARPPRFRHLWYGLMARFGLRRNPLGGYGGFIPEPSSSG